MLFLRTLLLAVVPQYMRFFWNFAFKQSCDYHYINTADADPPFNQLDQAACMELAGRCKCVVYTIRASLEVLANTHKMFHDRYFQHDAGNFVYRQGGVFHFGYMQVLGRAK